MFRGPDIIFLTHKRHPKFWPCGQFMGCLLWVFVSIFRNIYLFMGCLLWVFVNIFRNTDCVTTTLCCIGQIQLLHYLQVMQQNFEQFITGLSSQIAKALRLMSLRYRSDMEMSDRCLMGIDLRVFAIWAMALYLVTEWWFENVISHERSCLSMLQHWAISVNEIILRFYTCILITCVL